ncbi:oxidoreductase [Chitinophaga sedimenti]|uniref:oxidoreductase n=1 Tax=Chitinophaga sedimenti TaxID=2033606 RepID=UPI0020063539|nr:oxidoreductase [Chitinophaga sedimenti]MCK7557986.1 oxidoreductase [Chitinophaga sedimenti]
MKVWFITGASKGLGLALAKQLLSQGYKVAATSRRLSDLQKALGEQSDSFLPLEADIKHEAQAEAAIARTVEHFGKLDVIVNNAGYGLVGGLEELTDAEARENFNVNVFGSLNVIRKALPYLRAQRSGYIFNISSIGGLSGEFPGFGVYCATKFAVNGLTEALAAEVKEFGIRVTVVEPGYFRTNFPESDSVRLPATEIAEYKAVRDVQRLHTDSINGNQPNDPDKAAVALIQVAEGAEAPLHLVLGGDAYKMAIEKLQSLEQNFRQWESVSASTAY